MEYDLRSDEDGIVGLLSCYLAEFMDIPPYEQLRQVGFGPGYTAVDALTLYMMIRQLKPKRYVEVGSGLSTYYCSLGGGQEASEGHPLAITCVEPLSVSRSCIPLPASTSSRSRCRTWKIALFEQLRGGDVLFIDSSHILRIDGDVPFLYLEVLPDT